MPYTIRLRFPAAPDGRYTLTASPIAMSLDVQDVGFNVTTPGALTYTPESPWDGPTGITRDYWNAGATMQWRNVGGDWIDSLNVQQGSSGYDLGSGAQTQSLVGTGQFSVDITSHQGYWGDEATVVLRRDSGSSKSVASRYNTDVNKRPRVSIVDANGDEFNVEVSCSAICNLSSTAVISTNETWTWGSGAPVTIYAFNVPETAVRPFASVFLWITVTYSYGTLVFKSFRLNKPQLFYGGTILRGLADGYTRDEGIEAHPDVYFAGNVDETLATKYFETSSFTRTSQVTDVQLGMTVAESKYLVNVWQPFTESHRWSENLGYPTDVRVNPNNNLPLRVSTDGSSRTYAELLASEMENTPEELYFRYYVKYLPDFLCRVEGRKQPGLAGRYGNWSQAGQQWTNEDAQGGTPGKGVRELYPLSDPKDRISGWSMRGHVAPSPNNANPLRDFVFPRNYEYTSSNGSTGFGTFNRWGDNNKAGWVCCEIDRWYCFEQYVKMNTLTGTPDALGNMTGNPDGLLRVWVDGVLVYEKNNIVYRHHPAIKIDEVWLDFYHGGTTITESEHTFRWTGIVVAKSYIGPMRFTPSGVVIPAWMENLPVNTWTQIPGSNINNSKAANAISHWTGAHPSSGEILSSTGDSIGYGVWGGNIGNFSGGVLREASSELLIWGGGGPASGYAGNDVLGISLESDSPRWTCRVWPTHRSLIHPTNTASEFNQDGSPNAGHSYRHIQYDQDGDRFYMFGNSMTWPLDSGVYYAGVKSVPIGSGVRGWTESGGYRADHLPMPDKGLASSTFKFEHDGEVFIFGSVSCTAFSFANQTWRTVYESSVELTRQIGGIFPTHGFIWRMNASGAINTWSVDGTTPRNGWATKTVVNRTERASFAGAYYCGVTRDTARDRYILFYDDGNLYELTYDAAGGQFFIDELSIVGTPPPVGVTTVAATGTSVAVWGRFQYVPRLDGVVMAAGRGNDLWFVRFS